MAAKAHVWDVSAKGYEKAYSPHRAKATTAKIAIKKAFTDNFRYWRKLDKNGLQTHKFLTLADLSAEVSHCIAPNCDELVRDEKQYFCPRHAAILKFNNDERIVILLSKIEHLEDLLHEVTTQLDIELPEYDNPY